MGRCKYNAFWMKCHNLKQRPPSSLSLSILLLHPALNSCRGSPWQCASNDESPIQLIFSLLMCCAAKTGAQELTWQTMNVKKNITWRDLGLSPIYMLLDLCCKRHLDPSKAEEEEMGHMITRDKTCLKTPTWKPLKNLMESQGESGEKQRKLAWFKMWQTHTAICGKSRRNLGKFSCNLWINSCNWPWELKMCHMFLVPVFETGSLRTFQLSTHTHEGSVSCRRGRYRERERRDEKDAGDER